MVRVRTVVIAVALVPSSSVDVRRTGANGRSRVPATPDGEDWEDSEVTDSRVIE